MPPIRAVKSAALFRLFHKTGPGVSGRNVPLGQTEKDRPRRRTTGQPSTAEMFTDRPEFEDTDDLAANIGRRDGSSIHESTPTVDFILGADDHLIGIAIHSDEALGLLDLPHKIIDGLGVLSIDG
jgi:hypothetical protein